MSSLLAAWSKSLLGGLLSLLLGVGVIAAPSAEADTAPLDPANPATPATVTADPLPTVQINGVAWSQVVVGNTVYVAGSFDRARPAGAAPGTQEVVRNNLLAYDIRTGELVTSFAPSLNAQALTVAASPDGSRIYVGGDFTEADGQARANIAAYSTATGQLISTFKPAFNSQVTTIAATNDKVYAGGWFTAVGATPRRNLAAVSASNGALLPWAPVPGPGQVASPATSVLALTVTNNGTQVVAGGRFGTLNGVASVGIGALDATTGATRPFAIGQLLTNQGTGSAVYSLTNDGTHVYGTAYNFQSQGNLEGSFKVTSSGGQLVWANDCRGDTYSSFVTHGVLYQATHAHDCGQIGSFPEQNPRVNQFATALSLSATGTVGTRTMTNANFAGKPAPTVLPWFPTFYSGSYTGQFQAGWSVSGNDQYVVYGGEFPGVNGSEQQGLVRFAVSALAPNKVAPRATGTFAPTVSLVTGAVRVSWKAVHDRDNENLTYRVYRDDEDSAPVCEVTRPSQWWNLPTYACSDTGAPAGSHRYLVVASDPAGNELASTWATATVGAANSSPSGAYGSLVGADGATAHWSLGETSGATAYDRVGTRDMTINAGVTRNQAGAIADGGKAFSFNGTTTGFLATGTTVPGPQAFSVEAWFQTTSRTGGKIVGFGNARTGASTRYDRHVYMDTAGRVWFGVHNGTAQTLGTTTAYNDGKWHHVVGTLGRNGMAFYVDGVLVGQKANVTSALPISGYWRVGGDTSWSGAAWFNGRIDEVAVYAGSLTAAQVKAHRDLAVGVNAAPTASFTSSAADLVVSVDGSASADADGRVASYAWEFGDGGTGTGATASHTYAAAGTYQVKLTVTDEKGATGTVTRAVTVTAPQPPVEEPPVQGAPFAVDSFGREVASGWGSAEVGGAWTVGGSTAAARVVDGAGQISGAAGKESRAGLADVAQQEVVVQADVTLPQAATGGGAYISLAGRRIGTSDYRATLRFQASGLVDLRLDRYVNGAETVLRTVRVPGTYAAGTPLTVRLELTGDGTTTLKAKAWAAGAAEPADWTVTTTDSTAALQAPGGVYLETYTASTATRTQVFRIDDLRAQAPGAVPAPEEPQNAAPTASFTSSAADLVVSVDGSASADADGRVASYAWEFGDGGTGTGATASHTYAAAGTYQVELTVTDEKGATGTVTRAVTVTAPQPPVEEPQNAAPTASFTSSAADLVVSVDGSASADADGRVASYAWEFGDGGTGTGATASHTYAAAGTYQVKLTVIDEKGATGTVTRAVTVTAPQPPVEEPPVQGAPFAVDSFGREVASGWGSAEVGGAWTVGGSTAAARVVDGAGQISGAAGKESRAGLADVAQQEVAVQADVTLPQAATGGGAYISLAGRRIGTSDYRATLRFQASGLVDLRLDRYVNGAETVLGSVRLPGTYTPGSAITVRLELTGDGTTTLKAKAWTAGTAEPADWTLTRTDSTAALQAPGGVYLETYTASTATRTQVFRIDDLWAGAAGETPAVR